MDMTCETRSMPVRTFALLLGLWLFILPQALNARSQQLLLDDHGTVPSPLNEEEVKHACTIGWATLLHDPAADLIQYMTGPVFHDPYLEVEHREVAVPPPKVII
jgi:hypothetical protein